MITAELLDELSEMIGALYGVVPDWVDVVPATHPALCRLVAGTMTAERVVLEALCSIRDGSDLVIAGDHRRPLQPALRLVRATAKRVGVAVVIERQRTGIVQLSFDRGVRTCS